MRIVKKIVRLDNKYFEIDPGSWREDLDVDIEVGIGYGDHDVKLQNISNFSTLIEKSSYTDQRNCPASEYL